ncbi:MAG: HAD family phosphatase [Acholeplasmatales bacterium]|nr:HAD family phosphatase [Acholeplasmatales bacterium]
MSNLDYLKKYKLFIVDYDGTILNSMPMWNTLLSNFLKENNIKTDIDIDKLAVEQTNSESVEFMRKMFFNDLSFDELANKMYEFVRKQYIKQELKPNSNKLLCELRKYGRVVLFSATDLVLLKDSFEINGINKYFDYIYSASNMKTSKTDGIGFLKVLEKESIDIKDTLVVEDVYHAIKGAKLQNIDTLAIYDNQKRWNIIKEISTYNLNLEDL